MTAAEACGKLARLGIHSVMSSAVAQAILRDTILSNSGKSSSGINIRISLIPESLEAARARLHYRLNSRSSFSLLARSPVVTVQPGTSWLNDITSEGAYFLLQHQQRYINASGHSSQPQKGHIALSMSKTPAWATVVIILGTELGSLPEHPAYTQVL